MKGVAFPDVATVQERLKVFRLAHYGNGRTGEVLRHFSRVHGAFGIGDERGEQHGLFRGQLKVGSRRLNQRLVALEEIVVEPAASCQLD